jgi:lipopolysaccharide transport system ATP-binding protein
MSSDSAMVEMGTPAGNREAIVVRNVGKRYQMGRTTGAFRYRSLREDIAGLHRRLGSRRQAEKADERTLWALRDISFEVQRGETVGLIGRNGAGKSTLLKVLSRITPPTEGRVEYTGRVGSLLEVGTGFHPELTGRENILLSGAILGMSRNEVTAKFDDIVEFAGIPRFIDTPVKRYSSGMLVRLGFSVAAHLEPDILLVDEVLAVGDAEFQRRCLGRMDDLGTSGRTVVFVSHNMPAVLRLCQRAILLDRGKVVADGPAHQVVRAYLESGVDSSIRREWDAPDEAPGDDIVRLKRVRVLTDDGPAPSQEIDIRERVGIETSYWNLSEDPSVRPTVRLRFTNHEGVILFETHDFNNPAWWKTPRRRGVVRATCWIPGNFFAEGPVMVGVFVNTIGPVTWRAIEHDAVAFDIVDRSQGDGARGEVAEEVLGVLRPIFEWTVEEEPA